MQGPCRGVRPPESHSRGVFLLCWDRRAEPGWGSHGQPFLGILSGSSAVDSIRAPRSLRGTPAPPAALWGHDPIFPFPHSQSSREGPRQRHPGCDGASVAQPRSDTTPGPRTPALSLCGASPPARKRHKLELALHPSLGVTGARGEEASHRLGSGTRWGSLTGSEHPQHHPPVQHHPPARGHDLREGGGRAWAEEQQQQMKSQGDGFQLSDVHGSLKALAGGVPRGGTWSQQRGPKEAPASCGGLCSSP